MFISYVFVKCSLGSCRNILINRIVLYSFCLQYTMSNVDEFQYSMFIEILSCHQICLDVVCVGRVCPRGAGGARRGPVFPAAFLCLCVLRILHASSVRTVRRRARKNEDRLVSLSLGRWRVATKSSSQSSVTHETTTSYEGCVPFPRGECFLFLDGHRCFTAKNRRDANAPKLEQGGGPAARP